MGRVNFTGVRGGGEDGSDSSSRESSPQRKQRRLASPNSDDEDDTTQPIADDDTPPPENRPILRKAMAFAETVTVSPSINTYEAKPATPSQTPVLSLPGQEVIIPKKKKETRSKKVKHSSNFPNHVGRFRVESYDPTAVVSTPPIQGGSGPYTSLYRASTTPFNPHDPVEPAAPTNPPPPPKKPRGKAKSPNPFTHPATFSVNPSTSTSLDGHDSVAPPAPGHHYRRDYDKDPFGLGQLSGRRDSSDATMSSHTTSPPPQSASSSYSYPRQSASQVEPAKSRVPARMVTILIIDIRSGTQDHQLAEVKIPLKPCEFAEDGFWADAKDLCAKLQDGPSRIDGPAKIYSMRGKYRQFFLTVTEDNKDMTVPANLFITPDRTIEVVVEVPNAPGQLPAPPQIPRELRSPSPDPTDTIDRHRYADPAVMYNKKRRHSPSADYFDNRPPPQAYPPGPPYIPYQIPHPYPQHPPTIPPYGPNTYHPSMSMNNPPPPAPKRIRSHELEKAIEPATRGMELPPDPPPNDLHARMRDPLMASPEPDDEEDIVFKKVIKRVDRKLQEQNDWSQWFRHRSRPQCVSNVLYLYRFAQRLFHLHEGKRVPFETKEFDITITRAHILAALQMKEQEEPSKFASDCSETLELLALYGPEGTRLQDSRVKVMMEDESPPPYNAKPIKRFLRLLREIDEEWRKKHSLNDGGEIKETSAVSMAEQVPS